MQKPNESFNQGDKQQNRNEERKKKGHLERTITKISVKDFISSYPIYIQTKLKLLHWLS